MTLAFCLAAVVFLSVALCAGVYVGVRRQTETGGTKRPRLTSGLRSWLRVYTGLVAATLIVTLLGLIGCGKHGQRSWAFEKEQLSRLAHVGYYVDTTRVGDEVLPRAFAFGGRADDSTFFHPAFRGGERLSLRPTAASDDSFRVAYEGLSRPLRLGRRSVNVPPGDWLDPRGGTLRIERRFPGGTWRAHAFRWERTQPASTEAEDIENRFYYHRAPLDTTGRPAASAGDRSDAEAPDSLLSETVLKEGQALATLLRTSSKQAARSLSQYAGRTGRTLQAAFAETRFVREKKGDPASRLGVIVADTVLANPDLRFYVNGDEITAGATSGEALLGADETLRYGLGYRRLFALRAPQRSNRDGTRFQNADYWATLENPSSWPLPPHPQDRFALVTGREQGPDAGADAAESVGPVPLDGYRIGAVAPAQSRYALARFEGEDLSALSVDAGTRSYEVSRGETFALGVETSGVLLSLRPQQAFVSPQVAWLSDLGNLFLGWFGLSVPRWISSVLEWISSFRLPYVGPMAALIVFLMACLQWGFLATDSRAHPRPRIETGWTLIWNLALTLLVVRLILSYRVALLPPPDASPGEMALFSGKNLQLSFWALLLVPLVAASVHWFTRSRRLPPERSLARFTNFGFLRKPARWFRENVLGPSVDAVRRTSEGTAERVRGRVPERLAPLEGGLPAVAGWGVFCIAVWLLLLSGALEAALSFFEVTVALPIPEVTAALGIHLLLLVVPLALIVAGWVWAGRQRWSILLAFLVVTAALFILDWWMGNLRTWSGSHDLTLVAASLGVALCLLFSWRVFLVLAGTGGLLLLAWGVQEVGLMRANLMGHLLLVIALAASAGYLTQLSLGKRIVISFFTTGALVLFLVATGDFGFLLLSISLGVALSMLFFWRSGEETGHDWEKPYLLRGKWRHWRRFTGLALAVLVLIGVSTGAYAGSSLFEEYVLPNTPDRVGIRFATLEDEAPAQLANWDYSKAQDYLGADQQIWQMLLYAAEGTRTFGGHGYGEAPLSDNAITYPTAMTDGVFSTFLLAEHGWGGGVFLMCAYLLLGLACLWLGSYFTDPFRHRLLPLAAVGTYFGFNALYMMCANIGSLVFTGQNVPFLSLLSTSDLLHGAVMLAVVACLSKANLGNETRSRIRDSAFWIVATVSLLLLAGAVWTGAQLWWTGFDSDQRDDFSLEAEFFDPLYTKPGQASNYEVVGRNIRRTGGKGTALLRKYIDRFNERPDPTKDRPGNSSPIFLSNGEIEVDLTHDRIASPFQSERTPWRGAVTAAAAEQYSWAGTPLAALPVTVSRDSAGTPVIAPEGRGELYVNGDEHSGPLRLTSLRPESVVSVQYLETGRWQNALYLGRRSQPLMQTVWRNGGYESIYPQRSTAPLAYGIKQAAQATSEASADTISLSLDLNLHGRLQEAVRRFAETRGYRPADELDGRRLAVSVTEAHSGEVRALAAWPFRHPQSRFFTRVRDSLDDGNAKEHFLANPNFHEHVIGSTFKPLLLTNNAAALGDALRIEDLTVQYGGNAEQLAGLPLGNSWDSRNNPSYQGKTKVKEFIRESNNAYLGILGMLGTYTDKSDIGTAPTMEPIYPNWTLHSPQFGGEEFYRGFDLSALPPSISPFEQRTGGTGLRPERLRQTALFGHFPHLFDVHFGTLPGSLPDSLWTSARARTFLPSLGTGEPVLKRVVPRPYTLDLPNYQSLRSDLVTFFLGSGDNRRTPVDMTGALARAVTGRRVTPTLEPPGALAPVFSENEGILPSQSWRNAYLIAPMEQVWKEGTMSTVAPTIRQALASAEDANADANYRVLMKTGTLDADEDGVNSLMLAFVVGRWRGSDADGQFVPGQTVTGHVHMENAGSYNRRFAFAREVLPEVIEYVSQLEPGDGDATTQ